MEVINSKNHASSDSSDSIFDPCNNEHWRAPDGKTGADAEIVVDMKCPTRLEKISIINGYGEFGAKDFQLLGSRNADGPWTEIYKGKLLKGSMMAPEV